MTLALHLKRFNHQSSLNSYRKNGGVLVSKVQNRFLPLVFGFCNFIFFNAIGQLILVEVTAVVLFVFSKILFLRGPLLPKSRDIKTIFILGYFWILAQVISDYFAHAAPIDTAKSVAQILVLLVLLYWVFSWLILGEDRLTYYLVGYALSSIPRYFLIPLIYDHGDPWKFVFGPNITLLVMLFLPRIKIQHFYKLLIIVGLVSVHLLLGSRSLGIITLLALLSFYKPDKSSMSAPQMFITLILGCAFVFIFASVYGNLASKGVLGQQQQIKYSTQKSAGPLILTGRSELLYEISAISETRIFGLGSNPYLNDKVLERVASEEYRFGVKHEATSSYLGYRTNLKIPNHSMIFTAWLEGGILAAIFWFYLLKLGVSWFMRTSGKAKPFGLVANYLAINFFWALLFSPLGAGSRVILAFTLGVMYAQKRKVLT